MLRIAWGGRAQQSDPKGRGFADDQLIFCTGMAEFAVIKFLFCFLPSLLLYLLSRRGGFVENLLSCLSGALPVCALLTKCFRSVRQAQSLHTSTAFRDGGAANLAFSGVEVRGEHQYPLKGLLLLPSPTRSAHVSRWWWGGGGRRPSHEDRPGGSEGIRGARNG